MGHIIKAEKLSKSYDTKVKSPGLSGSIRGLLRPETRTVHAVDEVSFSVEKGEMVAFLGPNGAGKSTTIKMLTGILHPTSGSISVMGMNPQTQRKQLAMHIGSVFGQKSQLWFHLPPLDSFRLLGSIYEIPEQEVRQRTDEFAELFGLKDLMKTPVRKLSLGERMRCEFAASMLHQPEILFLDEPTIGMDVVVRQTIRELIRQVNREKRTTVFLTSHDMGDVEQLCQRALIINHGRLVLDAPVSRLRQGYLSRKVIDVTYAAAPENQSLEGLPVVSREGVRIRLEEEISDEGIHRLMSRLLKAGPVMDISVSEISMEEVIMEIYRKEAGEEEAV